MRSMGRYREIGVVVGQLESLAQVKLGVVAEAGDGISGRMFTLGDPEFAAVEPMSFLARSVGHAHEDSALVVQFYTR